MGTYSRRKDLSLATEVLASNSSLKMDIIRGAPQQTNGCLYSRRARHVGHPALRHSSTTCSRVTTGLGRLRNIGCQASWLIHWALDQERTRSSSARASASFIENDEESAPQKDGWVEALLLGFFACQNRSALASRCLVETILEMWHSGVTFEHVQVMLVMKGAESGFRLLAPLEQEILVSWVALIQLALQEVGVAFGQPANPTEGGEGGASGSVPQANPVAAMRQWVRDIIGMYREGMDSRRLLLQQAMGEGREEGVSPSPSILMMQQYTRLVITTLEVVDMPSAPGPVGPSLEPAERGGAGSTERSNKGEAGRYRASPTDAALQDVGSGDRSATEAMPDEDGRGDGSAGEAMLDEGGREGGSAAGASGEREREGAGGAEAASAGEGEASSGGPSPPLDAVQSGSSSREQSYTLPPHVAYVYGFASEARQREIAGPWAGEGGLAQLDRRAAALRLLVAYLGALDESLYSARAFVAEALHCYRRGWSVSELFAELRVEEFIQGGGILPLGATSPSETQQLSMRVFALWLSITYMSFVQLGVSFSGDMSQLGWAWVEGLQAGVEAHSLADLVSSTLCLDAQAEAADSSAGASGSFWATQEQEEDASLDTARHVSGRQAVAGADTDAAFSMVMVQDPELAKTSSTFALVQQQVGLIRIARGLVQEMVISGV
eukprot:jgi/Botrbrau1/22119/Bobra.0206s0043.1